MTGIYDFRPDKKRASALFFIQAVLFGPFQPPVMATTFRTPVFILSPPGNIVKINYAGVSNCIRIRKFID